MTKSFGKGIVLGLGLALLLLIFSASAQTDISGQNSEIPLQAIKSAILQNFYDLNNNQVIDNFDKLAFYAYVNNLKMVFNQSITGTNDIVFDLNNDSAVNQNDLNICKSYFNKMKRFFGLRIVTTGQMKALIAEQRSDVNGDGMVNSYDRNIANDFYKLVKKANNTGTSSESWQEAYDLNNDGTVNRDDATATANFLKLIRTNNNQITVSMSEISLRLYMLDPDLNGDGVVNLTDLYIYKGLNKNLRKCYGPVSDDCAFYDLNDDQAVNSGDAKWLNGFYKILKVQKDFVKSVPGTYEYDSARIKAAVSAGTADLSGNGLADDLDLLLYSAYSSNQKSHNRQTFTPDASSTEAQVWEFAAYDLNDDNAINSADTRILSSYYKILKAAYRDRMNLNKLNAPATPVQPNANVPS